MSLATEREYQVGFFQTLLSNASCSTNATPPGVLQPALNELANIGNLSCEDAHGMVVGNCLLAEYVNDHCVAMHSSFCSPKGLLPKDC